jgi:hypothetical protein
MSLLASGHYRITIKEITMAVYRTRILSAPEVTAVGGDLIFDTVTERRSGSSPDFVWTQVQNGHRSVTVNYLLVQQINSDPLNDTKIKKRKAFEDLVKSMVSAWLLDMADEAATMFGDWYQGQTFPIDITVRSTAMG